VALLDFLSLVLFIIFGGIAGFITNRIAISHLFKNIYFFGKRFKPFKSVIARTRDELSENISNLVEEKIITPEKMLDAGERNKILLDEEINKVLLKAGESEGLGKSVADFDQDGDFEKALEKTVAKVISDNLVCFIEDILAAISFEELIDEEKTVFFSTHIISDLEKIADYIVYLKDGSILLNESVNDLTEKYKIVKGDSNMLDDELKSLLINIKETKTGFSGMTENSHVFLELFGKEVVIETPTIEEVMVRIEKDQKNKVVV